MLHAAPKMFIGCFFFLIAWGNQGHCQVFSTDNRTEELFLYEVKGIDEFIERFNDEKNTLLRKELEQKHKNFMITRKEMLVSLFNLNANWVKDSLLVVGFFNKVLDKDHPQFLNFGDSSWYAEAKCIFLLDSKRVEIPVILHVKNSPGNGMKWMIAGIGDNVAIQDTSKYVMAHMPNNKPFKFIQPSSYATNFIELFNVFTDSMEADYFFEPYLLATPRAKHFIDLVMRNKLELKSVKSVDYHFYQIDDWVFNVGQFTRQQTNSGWLVSKLEKVNKKEKDTYRKRFLHI